MKWSGFSRGRSVGLAISLLSGAALAGPASGAWSQDATVELKVYGHEFEHVHVEADGCRLHLKVAFDAPAKGYEDERNAARNYYLFKARVKFSGGQTVFSKVFGNPAPGARVYGFDVETEGCWSKSKGSIAKFDVIGCRGRVCDLGDFPPI